MFILINIAVFLLLFIPSLVFCVRAMRNRCCITKDEIDILETTFDALYFQRSTYDQENGSDGHILDLGSRTMERLKKRLNENR
jgi:hypothetical protein